MVFICISLVANNVKHLFIHYLPAEPSFWWKIFLSFSHFLIRLLFSVGFWELFLHFRSLSFVRKYFCLYFVILFSSKGLSQKKICCPFWWSPVYEIFFFYRSVFGVKSKDSLPSTTTQILSPMFFLKILYLCPNVSPCSIFEFVFRQHVTV